MHFLKHSLCLEFRGLGRVLCITSRLRSMWTEERTWMLRSEIGKQVSDTGCHLQYPNGWFKVQLFPFGTTAVANGPLLINELRNVPDDSFSFAEFADKVNACLFFYFLLDKSHGTLRL